jgi:hypothetical protein
MKNVDGKNVTTLPLEMFIYLKYKKLCVTDGICQVYFELDLTNAYTIAALTSCQLLPRGLNLSQVRYSI